MISLRLQNIQFSTKFSKSLKLGKKSKIFYTKLHNSFPKRTGTSKIEKISLTFIIILTLWKLWEYHYCKHYVCKCVGAAESLGSDWSMSFIFPNLFHVFCYRCITIPIDFATFFPQSIDQLESQPLIERNFPRIWNF